jgi:hypothetical protein
MKNHFSAFFENILDFNSRSQNPIAYFLKKIEILIQFFKTFLVYFKISSFNHCFKLEYLNQFSKFPYLKISQKINLNLFYFEFYSN